MGGDVDEPLSVEILDPDASGDWDEVRESWLDEDPGSFYILSTTRPMPYPRRADSMYSFQAI